LLGKHNEILLSDFGIAVMAQSSRYQNPQDMAGTMTYMAPEQMQGKARTASDQYSLGIVVYEWLTGQRPFHGSLTELIGQHISTPPPSILKVVPSLPPAVETVVMKALAKDPKDRYASIADFSLALEQACKDAQPQTPAATTLKVPAEKSPETKVVAPSEVYKPLAAGERVIAPPIQSPVPDYAVSSQKTIKQWFYEALTSLENAQYIEALAAIKHVLVLDANLGYAHNTQGLALYYLKLYTEALTALEHAITLNPKDVTAHYGKGLTLEQLQRYPEALKSYEQVTLLSVPYASGWRKKGDMLSQLKRYEESLAAYEQALKLDPNDADTYIGKGTALKLLGRKM
jgi:Protein kinase domain/TPR repeat/Tetratricopeptide repeat